MRERGGVRRVPIARPGEDDASRSRRQCSSRRGAKAKIVLRRPKRVQTHSAGGNETHAYACRLF